MNNIDKKMYCLNQIYFYLTEGCNLRCRHCWIDPEFQNKPNQFPVLPLDLFKSIVVQANPLGLSGVKLTGGEPLMHPDIVNILDFVQKQELNLVVETNGVLCDAEIARKMAACKSASVSVSLDGVKAETHEWVRGVSGCFEAALHGIKNLVAAGIKTQIIMSLMRRTKDDMEKMVRLAEALGVASVKFNIVMPIARGKKLDEREETLPIETLVELGAWVENTLSKSTDILLYYDHPAAFRPLSRMFGEKGNGCSRCGILGILGVLASGAYALCGIGRNVPELVFGDASIDRLEDVWNNTSILKELREGLTDRLEGICGDCLMKGLCLGSCIALTYYRTNNLWAPFWYCEEARKAGLLQKTRIRPVG